MDPVSTQPLEIVGYSAWGFYGQVVPAWKRRDWMDATAGFAYHCLPMGLANQSGWFFLAPHAACAEWNGGPEPKDLTIQLDETPPHVHAMSAVGSGILTWTVPYLFRTPPDWNLLCRGPANHVKDGIFPLEGLVETDWSVASFSMNWKFTRPGRVHFAESEPVAMLVPYRRGDLEAFNPRLAELSSNPDLQQGYSKWIQSRREFLAAQQHGDPLAVRERFQKHYFSGQTNVGAEFQGHQKSRDVKPFDAAKSTTSSTATGSLSPGPARGGASPTDDATPT